MKKTTVYLDMDGTIADLYGIENWLDMLNAEMTEPFEEAEPMVTEETLFELFPPETYEIKILTMTPKNATETYRKRVEVAKGNWLDKHFPNLTKRIYRPYGHNKNLKHPENKILVDNNEIIRNNFRGTAINPTTLW